MIPVLALLQAAEAAPDPASLASPGLRSFAALAVVGLLLAGAVWALRRAGDVRRGRQTLSVESALSLEPRASTRPGRAKHAMVSA